MPRLTLAWRVALVLIVALMALQVVSAAAFFLQRSAATEAGFVSSTAIAAFTPPHVTGGAVDITLDAGAGPLALGTDFDSFEPAAGVAALEGLDSPDAVLRRVLYWSLVSAGFAPYAQEWWHYSYGDQNWAIFTSQPQARYGEATESDGPVVR